MKRPASIHPFLFGIFPVLFLFSRNADQLQIHELVAPVAAISAATLIVWFSLALILKDRLKAAIITSFMSLFFFSFGPLKVSVARLLQSDTGAGTTNYAPALWSAGLIGIIYAIAKTKHQLHMLATAMNATAIVLTAIPASMAVYSHAAASSHVREIRLAGKAQQTRPDIYYIILDGYARPDILKRLYGYDNSDFTVYLRKRGFYLADRSTTNYCQTPLSLASSLNFEYLDNALGPVDKTSRDAGPLFEMIHHSNTASFLRTQGYKIVAFSSGYGPTDLKASDAYLSPRWYLDEFDNTLVNSTPVPWLIGKFAGTIPDDLYRGNITFILENLPKIALKGYPKFVFAHITSPHEPFVFDRKGTHISPDKRFPFGKSFTLDDKSREAYITEYRDQVIFTENKIKTAIDGILSNSRTPPIIIIQADHGPHAYLDWYDPKNPGLTERMSIFNAYYLPGGKDGALYREISPVNTFRFVFKYYFSADVELLEDRSYFSTPLYPYRFTDVTDKVAAHVPTPARRLE